jgi:hypothetical protein
MEDKRKELEQENVDGVKEVTEEMLEDFENQVIPQQIDGLGDVEELEPEEDLELDESTDSEFDEFNKGYNIDKRIDYLDEEKGEIVDRADLTPWEMIESLAKQMGTELKEPKQSCKDCYGRGYTGIHVDTNTPIPCMCIFDEEAKKKQKEMMSQLGFMNRRAKRHLRRAMIKERQLWIKKQALSDDRDRQLRIKRKKKKADKVARRSRRINHLNRK